MKNIWLKMLLPALFLLGSCQKEIINPNAATQEDVLKSVDGLLGMVVGIKKDISVGATSALYNVVSANGLTTKELYVINTGNGELAALEKGGSTLGNSNAIMGNVFTSCNLVKSYAQQLIDNAGNISDGDVAAYVRGFGNFYRAWAIGTMAQFWEKVPIEVVTGDEFLAGKRAAFVDRNAALLEAIRSLEAISVPAAQPAYFTQKVGSDINLVNAANALKARFALMAGDYAKAKSAAEAASLTVKSIWKFEKLNANPIFNVSLQNNNTYNGVNNFGLPAALAPDAADGRVAFYLGTNPPTGVKVAGFFTKDEDPIPVYLPGEMLLIQAECEARAGTLDKAVEHLNKVREKTADAYNVTAKLAAFSSTDKDAVLAEIYRNRCIELYMSGMKLEDSRRFNRPGPTDAAPERNRNFYPYPVRERDNNPNTPADPAI